MNSIKIYRDAPPKFPNGGIMTKHLESLNVGDSIYIEGPIGRCTYKHNGKLKFFYTVLVIGLKKYALLGNFELRHDKISPMITKTIKNLGLIAGGSGNYQI